jgi:2-polyprenyl-3-methyl-5-hydroxy-6-metoxy-1,4-benzoquinol methylase
MSDYTIVDYIKDLHDPNLPHIKSREHFQDFYNFLGTEDVQKAQSAGDYSFFLKPKGNILELGCHWGFNCLKWAKMGFVCTGVDLSKTLIEHGRSMIAQETPEVRERITLIVSFIEDFIPQIKYDTVVLTETLEHVMDPEPVIKKAGQCLKSTGLLYASAPSVKTGNNSHVRGITREEMERLIKIGGMQLVSLDVISETTIAVAQRKTI